MSVPPTYHLHDLGPQAQQMSKHAGNERMAMLLQYVAVGSMIVMAGVAASHELRAALDRTGPSRHRGREEADIPHPTSRRPVQESSHGTPEDGITHRGKGPFR